MLIKEYLRQGHQAAQHGANGDFEMLPYDPIAAQRKASARRVVKN